MSNTANDKPEPDANTPARSAREANEKRRRACYLCEEVKARHTTHWDLDAMPRDELEAAYAAGRPDTSPKGWGQRLRAWVSALPGLKRHTRR